MFVSWTTRTVLISGAGVAGSTLAYWLARRGFRPTIVERAAGLRSSGNPVDVRGPAVPVTEAMGVMPRLRAAATEVTSMCFLNVRGQRVGHVDMGAMRAAVGSREVELPRADLASILFEAASSDAEILFDDTIVALDQDEHGVDVTFAAAPARRFDLVIGADGLHSVTRWLTLGDESAFVRHMGLYVATMPVDVSLDARDVLMHNTPGRATSIHPGAGGHAIAAFIFRHEAVPGFDYRDTEQHKRIVLDAYAGGLWRIPELLDQLRRADDLYFDSVSQVRLPAWSSGRVALLGDAASCVSLFGEGSSLAIAGAHTLAAALASTAGDHRDAFAHYETRHRRLVEPKLRAVAQAAALIVPKTRAGIAVRNAATRLWPIVAAAQWTGRRLSLPRSGDLTPQES